ncbi:MAG: hypothetical protein AAFP78_10745 [Pseudomonadota bacterium]
MAALGAAGAESRLHVVQVAGRGNGHWAMAVPTLWEAEVEAYLNEVAP